MFTGIRAGVVIVAGFVAALMAIAGSMIVLVGGMGAGEQAADNQSQGQSCDGSSGGYTNVSDVTDSSPSGSVPGLSAEQAQNAKTIIAVGKAAHIPAYGWEIAIAASLQESGLRNLSGGDRDSLGLFQQRPSSGWGTPAQITNPTLSAEAFFGVAPHTHDTGLTQIPGWQSMQVTVAAQAVQHSGFPTAYAEHEQQAASIVQALAPEVSSADLTATASSGCSTDFTGDSGVVGTMSANALMTRARDYAEHGGSGWLDRCQHFVAVLAGRSSSGYATATDAMASFKARGVFHENSEPAVGAWLYFTDSTNPAGHVATYLGNGLVASTDVFGEGRVGIGPVSAITQTTWHMQYRGWAAPWGQEGTALAGDHGTSGGAVPGLPGSGSNSSGGVAVPGGITEAGGSFTIASQNLLGANHTDGHGGHGLGGTEDWGWPSWSRRLPHIFQLFNAHGVSVAGIQETQAPQTKAIARSGWGIYPKTGDNHVIWDPSVWSEVGTTTIPIPYFRGDVPMPFVELENQETGSIIAVMSVHNARIGADANRLRGLAIEKTLATQLRKSSMPLFILGDFNDGIDGSHSARCTLAGSGPMLSAQRSGSCARTSKGDIDHIFATAAGGLSMTPMQRDMATKRVKASDHPMAYTTVTLPGS